MNRIIIFVGFLVSVFLVSCASYAPQEVNSSVPVYTNPNQLVPQSSMSAPPPTYKPRIRGY